MEQKYLKTELDEKFLISQKWHLSSLQLDIKLANEKLENGDVLGYLYFIKEAGETALYLRKKWFFDFRNEEEE